MTRFRKRAAIIAVWIILLVLTNIIIYNMESRVYLETAQEDLLDLSITISGQIPVLTENDYYTRMDSSGMEFAKLKALSLALGNTEDIREQKAFLEEFAQAAHVEGLTVYGRDAVPVLKFGEVSEINIDPAVIRSRMNSGRPDITSKITEADRDRYLSSLYLADEDDGYFSWSTENGKWLLVTERKKTDAEEQLLNYFSWKNVLSKITIGRTGFVLAVADEDGIVLSSPDQDQIGQSVEAIGIRIGDSDSPASFSELMETFRPADRVQSVRIGTEKYYAARLKEDHALMLALFPENEIRENVDNATSSLVILVILITGISVLFAFFHIQDTQDFERRPRGRFAWNSVLAGRLKIMAILTAILLLVCGIYLEALSAYAETFRYTSNKVSSVMELLKDNSAATSLLSDWFGNEYLTKCRVIKCILDHTAPEKVTREYLSELSGRLDIRSIFVYDVDGKIRMTDSPYNHENLSLSDPFFRLLRERPELVGDLEHDAISGESRQKAGISLLNEHNECTGMIMIVTNPAQFEQIRNNLGFSGVYEQISLKDDSFVMVIRNNDMTIQYLAEVEGGTHRIGLHSYDYTGYPITEMGISETELRDHYNGNLFVLQNRYFASVRRLDDYYLLVMRPQIHLSSDYLKLVIIAVLCSLIFTAVLILLSCLEKKETAIKNAEAADRAAAMKNKDPEGTEDPKRRDDDVIGMLSSLINKRKPYFEQRWPEDSIRWKDKTTDEKFSASMKYILILTLTVIFVHVLTAGEGSLWYYCFSGQWDSGINLYSLTYCMVTICGLFVIKLVMHKLLFLTARAVKPKGETFCHLLDSFSGYGLVITGIFLCLSHFGVNSMTLSLTGGVAGVIFGIGCQNIVADILAGILMAFEGNVYVGDYVSFNGQYGVVLSIGVRTTRLKWFGEDTIIRNNDFKNFIHMPSRQQDRAVTDLSIDLKESLERVESILQEELPVIHDNLCRLAGDDVSGPNYRGVKQITKNGVVLSFSIFCKGMYYAWLTRALNRELKLMCERHGINIG